MLWGIICLVLLVAPAHARPLPPPPSDFQGDIYVDDRGCVFNRNDRKWVARKVDARQICGFPPSLSSLRLQIPEETLRPPTMFEVEQDLNAILASDLRQGEHVLDKQEREYIAEAPLATGQDKFAADLIALAQRGSELQTLSSGSFRSDDICKRLGYPAEPDPRPVLGWDVTLGLCPGVRAHLPHEKIEFGKRLKEALAKPANASIDSQKPKAKTTTSATNTALSGDIAEPQSSKTGPDQKPREKAGATRPTPKKLRAQVKTVNHDELRRGEKYVEVGLFHDDQTAEQAIRSLIRMGYKAAHAYRRQDRQTVRIIYAGPFDDRSGLALALDTLQKKGYPNAVIR